MIAIVDYGVGNLFSLKSSFAYIGREVTVTSDAETLEKSDGIILPGVGAFADAAQKLRNTGLDKVLIEQAASGKKLLGVCLGMQLLFDESLEYGTHKGLGLIKGRIVKIPTEEKIPQMGWNSLDIKLPKTGIFKYVENGCFVYFVHSYHACDCPDVTATVEYGTTVTAAVAKNNVYGTQFHPEKSGDAGLEILRAFCDL